ncbi:hypothetical protein BH18ACI4_BH18ACI4_25650 [soil metagenome]
MRLWSAAPCRRFGMTFTRNSVMRHLKKTCVLLALPLVLSLAPEGWAAQRVRRVKRARIVKSVAPKKIMKAVKAETWGGEHVRIEFNDGDARVEFDCAHGTLTDPLKTDSEGRFTLNGTYVREGPGPIRLNVPRVSQPARYSGRIKGDEMSLSVTLNNSSQEIGTFTLTRGSEGLIRKCR